MLSFIAIPTDVQPCGRDFRLKKTRERNHFVYFIAPRSRTHVKIGLSCDPGHRIAMMQGSNHEKLEMELLLGDVGDRSAAHILEDALHQRFAKWWTHSEWFVFSDDIHVFIQTCRLSGRCTISRPAVTIKQMTNIHGELMPRAEVMAALA